MQLPSSMLSFGVAQARLRMIALTVLMGSALSGVVSGADSVVPSQLEDVRRKAVDALNAGDSDTAERGFFELLSMDPKGKTASYSLAQLKEIQVKKKRPEAAIAKYRELKLSGKIKGALAWVPEKDDFFEVLKEPGKVEEHLSTLFKAAGLLAARTSFLGILLQGMGFIEEANYYVGEANQIAKENPEIASTPQKEKLRAPTRPLQYMRPGMMQRQGRVHSISEELHLIAFTNGKRSAQSATDWNIALGIFPTYDSNVIKIADGAVSPAPIQRPNGVQNTYLTGFGFTSPIDSEFAWGGQYDGWIKHHTRSDLSIQNTWSHVPGLWLSRLVRGNELRLRYDYSLVRQDTSAIDSLPRQHGPQLTWAQDWGDWARTQLAYSYQWQEEGVGVNSSEHEARAIASSKIDERNTQTLIQYQFRRTLSPSWNRKLIEHVAGLGSTIPLGAQGWLKIMPSFGYSIYPSHRVSGTESRTDTTKQIEVDFGMPLLERVLEFTARGGYYDRDSNVDVNDYDRYRIGMGFTAALTF